ncbi:MAG: DUF2269 family protein [Chloroflexota bacterium]|nr:DUF2269 family protein [Chloroflexota bacterium]
MPWFPILLVTHIALAVSLLLPSLLLPFLLRRASEGGAGADVPAAARILGALQGTGSLVIGLGLAATGIGLLAVLGPDLLRKPWLIAALAIYAGNLLVAALVSRPNLRRLLGRDVTADPASWNRRARRQRLLAYAMAAATGLIGFLMSTKPEL